MWYFFQFFSALRKDFQKWEGVRTRHLSSKLWGVFSYWKEWMYSSVKISHIYVFYCNITDPGNKGRQKGHTVQVKSIHHFTHRTFSITNVMFKDIKVFDLMIGHHLRSEVKWELKCLCFKAKKQGWQSLQNWVNHISKLKDLRESR